MFKTFIITALLMQSLLATAFDDKRHKSFKHALMLPDNKTLCTSGKRGEVKFWQTGKFLPIKEMQIGDSTIIDMALSSSKKVLLLLSDNKLHRLKLSNFELQTPLQLDEGANKLSVSDVGIVAIAYYNSDIAFYDLNNQHLLYKRRFKGASSRAEVYISADAKNFVTAGKRSLTLSSVNDEKNFKEIPVGHGIDDYTLDAKRNIVYVLTQRKLHIIDLIKQELQSTYNLSDRVKKMTLSSNGNTLLLHNNKMIIEINLKTMRTTRTPITELNNKLNSFYDFQYYDESKKLLLYNSSRGYKFARTWDTIKKEPLDYYLLEKASVENISLSKNDKQLFIDTKVERQTWDIDIKKFINTSVKLSDFQNRSYKKNKFFLDNKWIIKRVSFLAQDIPIFQVKSSSSILQPYINKNQSIFACINKDNELFVISLIDHTLLWKKQLDKKIISSFEFLDDDTIFWQKGLPSEKHDISYQIAKISEKKIYNIPGYNPNKDFKDIKKQRLYFHQNYDYSGIQKVHYYDIKTHKVLPFINYPNKNNGITDEIYRFDNIPYIVFLSPWAVKLYDPNSKKMIKALAWDHEKFGSAQDITATSDGKTFYLSCKKGVTIFDVKTGENRSFDNKKAKLNW